MFRQICSETFVVVKLVVTKGWARLLSLIFYVGTYIKMLTLALNM